MPGPANIGLQVGVGVYVVCLVLSVAFCCFGHLLGWLGGVEGGLEHEGMKQHFLAMLQKR